MLQTISKCQEEKLIHQKLAKAKEWLFETNVIPIKEN